MMFSAFCPTHDSRVLLTRRNLTGFWNGPNGPVLTWRCECGHEGLLDRSGSVAAPANETSCPDLARAPADS